MGLQVKCFRNIYIIDNMAIWESLKLEGYSPSSDLVLTYDLELYKYIESNRGCVEYFDHLVDTDSMESNNYRIYDYFARWNLDENGKDLLRYKGVDFGFSFRLNFWNDYVAFVRLFLSAMLVKNLDFSKLFLCGSDQIERVFEEVGVNFIVIDPEVQFQNGFYFPIDRWMDQAIRPSGFRRVLFKTREIVVRFFGYAKLLQDKFFSKNKKVVFFQAYHPTHSLINLAISRGKFRVLLENFTKHGPFINKFKQCTVPILSGTDGLKASADKIMIKLKEGACQQLKVFLNNEQFDITGSVNEIIFKRVDQALVNKLRLLESVISYLSVNRVDLVVLIANIGELATIFDLACKSKGIQSYMIINGLMTNNYMDEAKYATYINSYSSSIKENYFQGMDNIVAFGDPRMDSYPTSGIKDVNRVSPTIVIGASGFNSTDLNSYTAVEFDFMYDILQVIDDFDNDVKIIIKVRPNGYERQYIDFINKYFGKLDVSVASTLPMKKVLEKADLYISIYSQTLFEASCMGIPVIYYKKDTEVINPPFDGKSELVTIYDTQELIQALNDFQVNRIRFDDFLDRDVMEKYIVPLDGKNLERNMNFIENILNNR